MNARFETIAAWANEKGWTRGAELGVLDGRTHLYLLEHCPQLFLVGVDVWDMPGFAEGRTKSGEKCYCQFCNETRERRKASPSPEMSVRRAALDFSQRSRLMKMRTVEAAGYFEDRVFDFVFVDGDHSREGVSADIAAWRSKVRSGGMLIGHDYNMLSVREAVAEHFPTWQMGAALDDHLWAIACP